MSVQDDHWDASEIPEHKRQHMYLDADGFLTIRLKPGLWIPAVEARSRIAKALAVDLEAAALTILTRLVSGHIIASAAGVFGPVKQRERIRIIGGRDMIPNEHWQWIKPTESLWLIGDLQMRVLGSDVASLRSVTYTDVRFLDPNIVEVIAAAASLSSMAGADTKPEAARSRGRPKGTGLDRSDAPLVDEINAAVAAGSQPSRTQAAWAIVRNDRAQGQSQDAIVDRLVRKARKAAQNRE